MAYMNQERKQHIAAQLKPVLKRYGMKGTLKVRNHSTIVLTLKSGPIDFGGTERSINTYWYHEHYSGVAREFLSEVMTAMLSAGWYDDSDASVDHFDTAYYVDVSVGAWKKPYVLTGAAA